MPLAFVLALVVVVAVALVLGRRASASGAAGGTRRGKKACKWSLTGNQKGRFIEYHCATCDVAAYSTTGQAPVICKRNLRGKS